jgi:hypothetical protein
VNSNAPVVRPEPTIPFSPLEFPRRFVIAAVVLTIIVLKPGPVLEAEVIRHRFKSLSEKPFSPDNLAHIKEVINAAETLRVTIDPQVLDAAATRIAAASSQNPAAWAVARVVADYRYGLHMVRAQFHSNSPETNGFTFDMVTEDGKSKPDVLFPPESVSIGQAARMERIGIPAPQRSPKGFSLIHLRGGALALARLSQTRAQFLLDRAVNIGPDVI